MGYAPGDSLKIILFSDLYNLAELFLFALLYFTYNTTYFVTKNSMAVKS